MSKPHYHFYCDESGQFEHKGYKESLIFGLLVPDNHKEELAMSYNRLKLKHNILQTFVHWKDMRANKKYHAFFSELVHMSCQSPIKMVCIRYEHDMLKDMGGNVSEQIFCNRYLYMIQSLIDTVLFFHPPLWKPETDFSFKHNTRVFPVKDKSQVDSLKALGYEPKVDNKKQGQWFLNVWTTREFNIFLRRRLADFAPYQQTIGSRNMAEASMQTAEKSGDPFVHWTDNLAGILMWKDNMDLAGRLQGKLEIEAFYGKEHGMYQHLVMTFLDHPFDEFLIEAFEKSSWFQKPYYRKQLTDLMERAFDHLDVNSPQIVNLARIVEDQVEKSSGRWDMVLTLTEKLLERLREKGRSVFAETATSKLQGACLSCLNHRGEAEKAKTLALQMLAKPTLTVDDLRIKAEIRNRLTVTCANRFDFIGSARELSPYIKSLLKSCKDLSRFEGHELKDPLIGRLASTTGQAFAFTAPFVRRHFASAETLLNSALKSCITPEDTLRQSIYLGHLYLDMDRLNVHSKVDSNKERRDQGRFDLASETVRLIARRSDVTAFLKKPAPGVSLSMAFVLALLLKYQLQTGDNEIPDVYDWTEKHAKQCFESCDTEHPFELIWSYMGQFAFLAENYDEAERYFEKALSIPAHIDSAPPVIQAIHCQILGLWARCHYQKNRKKNKAVEKIKTVIQVMHGIANSPGNETIIIRDGGGWFGPAVQALAAAVDKREDLTGPLTNFLDRFTFNYR